MVQLCKVDANLKQCGETVQRSPMLRRASRGLLLSARSRSESVPQTATERGGGRQVKSVKVSESESPSSLRPLPKGGLSSPVDKASGSPGDDPFQVAGIKWATFSPDLGPEGRAWAWRMAHGHPRLENTQKTQEAAAARCAELTATQEPGQGGKGRLAAQAGLQSSRRWEKGQRERSAFVGFNSSCFDNGSKKRDLLWLHTSVHRSESVCFWTCTPGAPWDPTHISPLAIILLLYWWVHFYTLTSSKIKAFGTKTSPITNGGGGQRFATGI